MRLFVFCLFCLLAVGVKAQRTIVESLQENRAGEGVVTIHQDAYITSLLGVKYVKKTSSNSEKVLKTRGFRVQVYAGNNSRAAREAAMYVAEKVKKEFPDMPVYTYFQPPRWLCRVGDFKSIEEAHVAMRKLKSTGEFKETAIVREQINIPIE
ncbi:SPOR domain-containing protein [Phocaeicola faecicola]|jgi:hypothetical protein|uniref:SPOR domain-containing protein n=1 Tax=Phocaeicola faecicola TaxID=2739389 RepID=UPI0015B6AEC2|nr:SPOR domain-containing protein [Phocaeicola faecicola]MCI5743856.1 SPOR domain-containing protein [Bacteroides sp.]MDD6907668.1 SPOR domain-containing protein [Bacteroidaceae bacterium]MDY4777811.1 SPOR domain-containing protein [Phocaeicola vulgatus]MDY4871645.1 SPOR domain-containing protein [Phocaeicola faecicola]